MKALSQLQEEVKTQHPKIHFSQKVFGKATKDRCEDPSMFELLAWNTTGVQPANFKKKQNFKDPESAYLNMISRNNWISQSQQNYLNYHTNALQVNEQVFQEVQNYIHSHEVRKKQPKSRKQNNISSINNRGKSKQNTLKQNYQPIKSNVLTKNNYINKASRPSQNITKTIENPHYDQSTKNHLKRPQSAQRASHSQSNVKMYKEYQNLYGSKGKNTEKSDQITQQQQEKLIQKFKQTTRWIPNSSFTTYFGKPPFENYGRGNTKPVDGGLVYGTYLYSHNVYPHRGTNSPSHVQSYPVALMKAQSMGKLIPSQPKTSCKYLQNKINNEKERQYDGSGSIQAQKNMFSPLQIQTPDLHGVQKFGATKKSTKTNFNSQKNYLLSDPLSYQSTKQFRKQ